MKVAIMPRLSGTRALAATCLALLLAPTTAVQAAASAAQAPENGVDSAVQDNSGRADRQAPPRRSTSRELLPEAGRLIFLDPDTGRLTSTPDPTLTLQLLDLVERKRALGNGIITVLPDGSLRGWPGPGRMHFLATTIDEQGQTRLEHVSLAEPGNTGVAVSPETESESGPSASTPTPTESNTHAH